MHDGLPIQRPREEEIIFRQERAVIFDDWVENSGLGAELNSDRNRLGFLRSLQPDTFIDLTSNMNRLLLDVPDDTPVITDSLNIIFDDDTEEVVDIMPAPEDKVELLGEVLHASQAVETPREGAMVLGFGLNAVHPWKYGANGRGARAAYALFSRDYRHGRPDLHQTLGIDGDATYLLDPTTFLNHMYTMVKGSTRLYYVDAYQQPLRPKVEAQFQSDPLLISDTPRRPYNLDQIKEMSFIFSQKDLGPLVASWLSENTHFASVHKSRAKVHGQDVFYADKFLVNASDTEIAKAYGFFRDTKYVTVSCLLELLVSPEPDRRFMSNLDKQQRLFTLKELGLMLAEHAFSK